MPMLDLTYPAGMIRDSARAALIEELTAATLRAEHAPDTELTRGITWVFMHELSADHISAGGRPPASLLIKLEITTPEGMLSASRRAQLITEATRAVCATADSSELDADSVWVLLREVPDGSWGAGGRVVRLEDLRRIAQAERRRAPSAA